MPGKGRRASSDRRAAARRVRAGRRAALRRARRQRLQRGRARRASPRLLAPLERADLAVRRRRATAARGALLRAAARRRGRVREWTSDGQPARTRPTRACARTSGRSEVVREDAGRGRAHAATEGAERQPRRAGAAAEARPRRRSTVEGRELKLSNLDKVLYPEDGLHQARGDRVLRRRSRRCCSRTCTDAADRHALARRRRGQVLLPEAGAGAPARVGAHRDAAQRAQADRLHARRRPADARVAREPRGARAAHAARARARRSSGPTALVFDLDPGAPATIVECCHVALQLQGMFENLGPAELRQDVGLQGPAGVRAAELARRRPSSRPSRSPRRSPSCSSSAEPELVVSRMTKARRTGKVLIDWSQNDAQQDDRLRLLAARRPSARPSRRRVDGRRCAPTLDAGDPARSRSRPREVLERVAERGDLFAPVLSLVQELPRSLRREQRNRS